MFLYSRYALHSRVAIPHSNANLTGAQNVIRIIVIVGIVLLVVAVLVGIGLIYKCIRKRRSKRRVLDGSRRNEQFRPQQVIGAGPGNSAPPPRPARPLHAF